MKVICKFHSIHHDCVYWNAVFSGVFMIQFLVAIVSCVSLCARVRCSLSSKSAAVMQLSWWWDWVDGLSSLCLDVSRNNWIHSRANFNSSCLILLPRLSDGTNRKRRGLGKIFKTLARSAKIHSVLWSIKIRRRWLSSRKKRTGGQCQNFSIRERRVFRLKFSDNSLINGPNCCFNSARADLPFANFFI